MNNFIVLSIFKLFFKVKHIHINFQKMIIINVRLKIFQKKNENTSDEFRI